MKFHKVVLDFEKALVNSLLVTNMVDLISDFHGCGFHLTQSLWKNAADNNLRKKDKIGYGKVLVFLVQMLQFVEVDCLNWVYEKLVDIFRFDDIPDLENDCQKFLNYFNRCYIQERNFKIQFWNISNQTHDSMLKMKLSTNNIESFHSG